MTDEKTTAGWKKTVAICVAVLAVAAVITAVIFNTEPTAKRGGARKQTAMLVELTGVERGTFRPTIAVTGSVRAEQDVVLSPQVAGEVVWRAPELTPGGFAKKGTRLLRIDPRDYQNVVAQRESALRQAKTNLAIEMGRQDVAQKDYELLDEELAEEKRELVLRKPQLEAARVAVDAAEADLAQAKLDLARTTLRAPFDAQVLSREVNVGSQVAPGDPVARLLGLDRYWVVASVPLSKLRWLSFPDEDQKGSEVRLRNRASWPEGTYRTGHVDELIGALEDRTRLARVLVTVDDPLARETDAPPLIVGEFLETRIEGTELADVVRLDRDLVRDRDTVWVAEDGKLRIREVTVVVRDESYVYISEGLDAGDQVVVTNLATVTDGARLRVRED